MAASVAPHVLAPRSVDDWLDRLCTHDPTLAPLSLRSVGDVELAASVRRLGDDAWWLNPLDPCPLWFVRCSASVDAPHLERAARAIASEAPGAAALVLAVRPDGIGFGVGASVDGGRTGRAWHGRSDGLDDTGRAVLDQLFADGGASLRAERVDRELRRRDVDGRFFAELRRVVSMLAEAFTGVPRDATEARRSLALLLVIRWMFLAFVQQKGWLGDDRGLLARLTLDPDRHQLYRRWLRPLFFEALNAPATDPRPPGLETVPFLNGGLFAPDVLEARYPELDLADDAVRAMQRRLFEAFRFVGRDGDDGEPAIRPTMLGTAFERLMGDDVRARTGAFYTPPDLVALVVEDAVDAWVAHRFDDDVARALSAGDAGALDRGVAARVVTALDGLRVLDPAVGSGAFLLGALDAIVRRRSVAMDALGAGASRVDSVRVVIARCLHGVDLSPIAVRLCELRLWLRVVADAPDGPSAAEPLPNLGHRLYVGDSLVPMAWRTMGATQALPPEMIRQRADLAVRLVSAHGTERTAIARRLESLERDLAARLVSARVADLEREVKHWAAIENGPDLFGELRGLTRDERARRDAAQALLDEARAESREFAARGHAVAFDPGVHFADVVARGGFDLVVGNPPWVRLSDLARPTRDRLRRRFAWMGAGGRGRAFGTQADLSVAFVEQSWRMVREGGVVGMLVPGKLFTSDYGAALRAGLRTEASVCTARNLSRRGAAWLDADAYPAALVARRGGSERPVRIELPSGQLARVAPDHLASTSDLTAPWPGLDDAGMRLYRRLRGLGAPLGRVAPVRMGVKTGLNRAFVDPPDGVGPCVPVVRGRDVAALDLETSGRLLFAHDPTTGEVLGQVPEATGAWLATHGDALDARADARAGDPRWRVFRVRREALGHRVVWSDLARHLAAAPLAPVAAGGAIALNSAFTAAVGSARDAMRLSAWLCALPAAVVASCVAEPARSGFRRYRARHMATVPVPGTLFELDGALALAFERAAERVLADRDDEDAWAGLDHAAAALAGLSAHEAAALRRLGADLGLDVGRGPGGGAIT